MRRRRADVDSDGPQAQSLARDVARVIRIVLVMTVMLRVVRMR
jgi:hypothetical protein